jgi:hypothetical protein
MADWPSGGKLPDVDWQPWETLPAKGSASYKPFVEKAIADTVEALDHLARDGSLDWRGPPITHITARVQLEPEYKEESYDPPLQVAKRGRGQPRRLILGNLHSAIDVLVARGFPRSRNQTNWSKDNRRLSAFAVIEKAAKILGERYGKDLSFLSEKNLKNMFRPSRSDFQKRWREKNPDYYRKYRQKKTKRVRVVKAAE